MNDWQIPQNQARLREEIDYYERKAREMQKYQDPHCMRMERMYRDMASHRRSVLTGLTGRSPRLPARLSDVLQDDAAGADPLANPELSRMLSLFDL